MFSSTVEPKTRAGHGARAGAPLSVPDEGYSVADAAAR